MAITMTFERHILTGQSGHPDATGTLTSLVYDLALAAKVIARETTRKNIVHPAEEPSPKEPRAIRLAKFADAMLLQLNRRVGRVGIIASEPHEEIMLGADGGAGKYVLMLDPMDGVSPTDYTISMGTIFGFYTRLDVDGEASEQDCLQPGRRLVAAGDTLYGSTTVMVYSRGQGVHSFTLDPGLGEFLLSHENITIPSPPRYYSVNHAHDDFWSPGVRRYVRYLQGKDGTFPGGLSLRYNLLAGGVFIYPADTIYPTGKMLLGFEANPLAFLAEQAGGAASDGQRPILDIEPAELHQRTPLVIGSRELVEKAQAFFRTYDQPG
jgi:fructose-1,6-bisphosphatase I